MGIRHSGVWKDCATLYDSRPFDRFLSKRPTSQNEIYTNPAMIKALTGSKLFKIGDDKRAKYEKLYESGPRIFYVAC